MRGAVHHNGHIIRPVRGRLDRKAMPRIHVPARVGDSSARTLRSVAPIILVHEINGILVVCDRYPKHLVARFSELLDAELPVKPAIRVCACTCLIVAELGARLVRPLPDTHTFLWCD